MVLYRKYKEVRDNDFTPASQDSAVTVSSLTQQQNPPPLWQTDKKLLMKFTAGGLRFDEAGVLTTDPAAILATKVRQTPGWRLVPPYNPHRAY